MSSVVLQVRDLRVVYRSGTERVVAVDGVNLDLQHGEPLGIVGESGSGKTSLATALVQLRPEATLTGSVIFDGRELIGLHESELRQLRGARIALAVQGSSNAFSPVHRLIRQMIDALSAHGCSASEARNRLLDAADRMHLHTLLLERYPHQLSGGEKQRAMLAMAIAQRPLVLIADEPTSGLDPITAAAVLDDLRTVQADAGFGLIIASHNVVDVLRSTDRVAILYTGRVVEMGASDDVIRNPRHPYTWGLMSSQPALNSARDLRGIRGAPPDPTAPPRGCRFHPRCTQAAAICVEDDPALARHDGRLVACHFGGLIAALSAHDVYYTYPGGNAPAVAGVTLVVRHGEVVAVVGETGSGKTTLARLLVGLLRPQGGRVSLGERRIDDIPSAEMSALRRRLQMVFQDPYEALSTRLTVAELVREPLDIQEIGSRSERDLRVMEILRALHLPVTEAFLGSYSHQLSGGQLQRLGVARALVLEPDVVIADEPVSMLDGSEQANLLNLLKSIQIERGLALVLVSHDIAAACRLADRVVVMHDGRVVEAGSSEAIALHPKDQYTSRLVAASRAVEGDRSGNGQEAEGG
jgi:peptide/nickel transport system ATP-binding protein